MGPVRKPLTQPNVSQTASGNRVDRNESQRRRVQPIHDSSDEDQADSQPLSSQASRASQSQANRQTGTQQSALKGPKPSSKKSDESTFRTPPQPSSSRHQSSTQSQQLQKSKGKAQIRRDPYEDPPSEAELIEAVIHYILSRQSKSSVILRTDIIREPMRGLRNMFVDVIESVEQILDEKLMLQLVGYEKSKRRDLDGWDSYILVGRVPFSVLCDPEEMGDKVGMSQRYLLIILEVMFMTGSPMELDQMWDICERSEFGRTLCRNGFDDFEKFIKTEYVSKSYLLRRDYTQSADIRKKPTYEWGMRSNYEYNKLKMLRNVAKTFKIQDLKVFSHAYSDAKKQIQAYGSHNEKVELNRLEQSILPIDGSGDFENQNEYVQHIIDTLKGKHDGDNRNVSTCSDPNAETQPMEYDSDSTVADSD